MRRWCRSALRSCSSALPPRRLRCCGGERCVDHLKLRDVRYEPERELFGRCDCSNGWPRDLRLALRDHHARCWRIARRHRTTRDCTRRRSNCLDRGLARRERQRWPEWTGWRHAPVWWSCSEFKRVRRRWLQNSWWFGRKLGARWWRREWGPVGGSINIGCTGWRASDPAGARPQLRDGSRWWRSYAGLMSRDLRSQR